MMKRREAREATFTFKEGDLQTITQEGLATDLRTVIKRIQSGQSVQSNGMPVYLDDKFQEIVGFENLSLLDKMDFVKQYNKRANADAVASKDKYELEIAEQKRKAEELIQSQQREAKQL